MGKIIATFKYGDLRTRLYLGAVLILLVLGIAGIISGLAVSEFLITALGILLILISAVVFVMGHFSSEAVEEEEDETGEDGTGKDAARKDVTKKDGFGKDTAKKGRTKKAETKKDSENVKESINDKKAVRTSENIREEQEKKDWQYRYTPDVLKTITKRYKVKRKFVPIIIDNCDSKAVSRTPALMWVKGNKVSFLLLEQNERVISLPMDKFLKVTYDHNVPERRMSDYEDIKNKLGVYEKFEDAMPTFSRGTDRMGSSVYLKNLYVLGGEIEITAKSFKKLKNMYDFSINLFDSLKLKGEYSHYFKRAYENRLLWTDTVISQAEYQTRMRGILEAMVRDKTIDRFDMDDDLDLMIRYRLITDEYATFYRSRK